MCLTLHLEQLRSVKRSRIYSESPGKLKFGASEYKRTCLRTSGEKVVVSKVMISLGKLCEACSKVSISY
jgi:hypothetical protein